MKREAVLLQIKESIATITLNRAGSKNAINSQMASELRDIANEISGNDSLKAVIVTGGNTFSVGTDREMCTFFERKGELIKHLSLACVVAAGNRPFIAAISGDTLGQGLELALACDLRICSDSAHFAMNHLTYGDIPWDGGTQRLSRVVGRGKAMEMILTGEMINAQEAHRIGLVHRVVPEDELLPAAMEMAREMATKSPIAVRYAKEAIGKGMDLTLEQGLRLEADLYFLLHTTKDRTEGIRAFQEKRKPEFEGM